MKNQSLEACEVRNSENCRLFTPIGSCSTMYDEDGNGYLCCENCCLLTDDEAPLYAEMNRLMDAEEAAVAAGRIEEAAQLRQEIAALDALI
jgi:hypothetical protein